MDTRFCPSLADGAQDVASVTARAGEAVADYAPQFASQIEAAKALRDRLDRDVVSGHGRNDTPVAV